jgi:hypothetical protein
MIKYIVIHHTGGTTDPKAKTQNQTAENVNEYHKQKWNFESNLGKFGGYNFFIDKSGKLTQFREVGEETAHTYGYNKTAIGICLAGNFMKGVETPTEEQKYRLGEVIYYIMQYQSGKLATLPYEIVPGTEIVVSEQNIVPHRSLVKTSCHGDSLPDSFGRDMYREYREIADGKKNRLPARGIQSITRCLRKTGYIIRKEKQTGLNRKR